MGFSNERDSVWPVLAMCDGVVNDFLDQGIFEVLEMLVVGIRDLIYSRSILKRSGRVIDLTRFRSNISFIGLFSLLDSAAHSSIMFAMAYLCTRQKRSLAAHQHKRKYT